MKKTLIALMALAGVAGAANYTGSQMNTWLEEALGNRAGSKYTLTFTLADDFEDGAAANLFVLSDSWAIREQHGKYVGLTTNPGAASPSVDGDYASRNNASSWDSSTIIDTDTAGANGAADYSGWFYEGANNQALRGTTFTIFSADNNTTITFEGKDQTITLQRNKFYTPPAEMGSSFGFGCPSASVFKSASITFDSGTYSIPEPTTATLSLLALAGLAARRRRK